MSEERFYIDCEFDGHNGPLLSMAIVAESDGFGVHMRTFDSAKDPWVLANVMPLMDKHEAHMAWACPEEEFGDHLKYVMKGTDAPVIIADSPVDIARFCRAISTDNFGGWASTDYPRMTFEVHNVDCYPTDLPGAVQHNAWWDAMALRAAIARTAGSAEG